MQEVVHSVQQVSAIIKDITLASGEQSTGVYQVGEAVAEMDQNTHRNAALVEEMAAAALGLLRQAHDLVGAVSVFRLPSSLPAGLALQQAGPGVRGA